MTTNSNDGVYLRGTGDLNLTFNDTSRHVEIELIAAESPDGIANLKVNDVTEQGAENLTGYAKSLGSLELHTKANVGTREDPFEIVTDASKFGTLILTGDNVNILQKQGDLLAEKVTAEGDLQVEIGGNIMDASDSELTKLLDEYRKQLAETNAQQKKLDDLLAERNAIMNNDADAKRKQELADARENARKEQAEYAEAAKEQADAQAAFTKAQKALKEAQINGNQDAVEAAKRAVEEAQKVLNEKTAVLLKASEELKQAEKRLQKAEDIEAKFQHLENTKKNMSDAYASGIVSSIQKALADYDAARQDTAPHTDYVKRAESDRDIAQKILTDTFGENFREKLTEQAPNVQQVYQPLLDMLDEAQTKLDEVNARLDELNGDAETPGSIAEAQKRSDEEQNVLDSLVEEIRKAQQKGDTPAIQAGGNADIQAAGSISGSTRDESDYVSIQVGGQLNTRTDGDTNLISPTTLNITAAKTGNNRLNLVAIGNVHVGTTDADGFSAAGSNIHVNLEGDAVLGDVLADKDQGNVGITSGGSITQETGTVIRGENLKIQANGNVDVDVYMDHADIVSGGDLDLSTGKSQLAVDRIHAGGHVDIDGMGDLVSGGGAGITSGGNVTIHMGGNIGSLEEDLIIYTDGQVTLKTIYGLSHVQIIRSSNAVDKEYPIFDRLLDDPNSREYYIRRADGTLEKYLRPGTGLEVFGQNLKHAFLWVGTEALREMLFADAKNQLKLKITVNGEMVFDYMIAIDRIVERILEDGKQIPVIDRDADGQYTGKHLTFRYFVGTEYDGCRYEVCIDRNGTVTKMEGTVTDGYITFVAVNEASSITVDLIC